MAGVTLTGVKKQFGTATAAAALQRSAPARGARSRHRQEARRFPLRRAAVEPRRQAPRADAGRDLAPPEAARDDHRLCHPRPGRGDDDGPPHRGDERGQAPAGRHSARDLRSAGEPLRGELHRHAADEPPPGDRRRWGAALAAAGFELPLAERFRKAVAARDGRKVVIGVRPEDVRETTAGASAPISVEVEFVEPLGHDVIVHGRVGDGLLVAKVDPHRAPRMGDTLALSIGLDKIHLFDAESEERLPGG